MVAAGERGRSAALTLALFAATAAHGQDVRGLERCTAEADMARRTGCLQTNVEWLQQELVKLRRSAADDKAAAAKETSALKAELAALKDALGKAQNEIAELKKARPAEKK